MELSAGALAAISQLLDVNAFEAKLERFERLLDVLESEAMDRELEIQRLGARLADQIRVNSDLRPQMESMDVNRRLASLIFTCVGDRAVPALSRRVNLPLYPARQCAASFVCF